MNVIKQILSDFRNGWKQAGKEHRNRKDKELRKNLDEKQIDKMLQDSFPASDPPSTY